MRRRNCEQCGAAVPLRDSFTVDGRQLCLGCAETTVQANPELYQENVSRNIDPTVCCNCGYDAGETELPTLLSLPTCDPCLGYFRNRPFPAWVKVAAAGLIGVVFFSLFWNWRFILAYYELRQLGPAMAAGDFGRAAELTLSAADRVPENAYLRHLAEYFHAAVLLKEDRCGEALEKLRLCRQHLPPDYGVDRMIQQAEMGVAFDQADYDKFLELALDLQEAAPGDPMLLAVTASAYACKYAETGEEDFREKSLQLLEEATANDRTDEMRDYEMRIRHRLHTREVIKRDEFRKRFPNGWTPPREDGA